MHSTQGLTKVTTTWTNISAGDILDGELVITVMRVEDAVWAQFEDFTWSPAREHADHISVYRDTREHADCVCC